MYVIYIYRLRDENGTSSLWSKEGRLLLRASGASFAALFPKLDALIGLGGLGVTSEALRAGVPIITSGILRPGTLVSCRFTRFPSIPIIVLRFS